MRTAAGPDTYGGRHTRAHSLQRHGAAGRAGSAIGGRREAQLRLGGGRRTPRAGGASGVRVCDLVLPSSLSLGVWMGLGVLARLLDWLRVRERVCLCV